MSSKINQKASQTVQKPSKTFPKAPKHARKSYTNLLSRIPKQNKNAMLLGLVLTFPLIFFAELIQGTILYEISGLLSLAGMIIILVNFVVGIIRAKK